MNLGDAVRLGLDLEARCSAPGCGARTLLSPVFFLNRLGAAVTLERLSHRLLCAGCGAAHPEIVACPPEEDLAGREQAPPHAQAATDATATEAAAALAAGVPENHI
jgi:hypothetical protein